MSIVVPPDSHLPWAAYKDMGHTYKRLNEQILVNITQRIHILDFIFCVHTHIIDDLDAGIKI